MGVRATKEIWESIKGYEGIYEVSNLGRVKSLDRDLKYSNGIIHKCKGRIIKAHLNSQGYERVSLKKDGIENRFFVHRLVAIHFVLNPDPSNYDIVNHIDCNPKNNIASNLEWTTIKGNNQYAIKLGRMDRNTKWLNNLHKSQAKFYKAIRAYDIQTGQTIKFYKALNDCKKDGFSPSCVCNCCKGKRKSHKGVGWEYVRDSEK